MNLTQKQLTRLRSELYHLDLETEKDLQTYEAKRNFFLIDAEGMVLWAYDDATGKRLQPGKPIKGFITVGVGFNMMAHTARKDWDAVLPPPLFDEVFHGRSNLTKPQVEALLSQSLASRFKDIFTLYRAVWGNLTGNERAVIESLYFNAPSLVGKKTRFCKAILAYGKNQDVAKLDQAIKEVRFYSNAKKIPGLEKRRQAEAFLLDSTAVRKEKVSAAKT